MFNFDFITKEDIKIIIQFDLINHEPDIDKNYMLKIHMKQNINY